MLGAGFIVDLVGHIHVQISILDVQTVVIVVGDARGAQVTCLEHDFERQARGRGIQALPFVLVVTVDFKWAMGDGGLFVAVLREDGKLKLEKILWSAIITLPASEGRKGGGKGQRTVAVSGSSTIGCSHLGRINQLKWPAGTGPYGSFHVVT